MSDRRELARLGTVAITTTPKDDGAAFILVRDGGPQLLLRTTELRWLQQAALPAVLPAPPTPAAAGRARGERPEASGGTPATPRTAVSPPPAEQPAAEVPPAAPAAAQDAAPPAPGPGVGYTILPGSDDEDAPPPDGGPEGGASRTVGQPSTDVAERDVALFHEDAAP